MSNGFKRNDNIGFGRTVHREVFGYNSAGDALERWPRIIIGTGSENPTPGITVSGVLINAARPSRLARVHLSVTLTPGSTAFKLWLYSYGGGTWSQLGATVTATPTAIGASLIEWTAPHVIPAGSVIAFSIDPTTAPGMVNGQLEFDVY